jgi:hypothetical protein
MVFLLRDIQSAQVSRDPFLGRRRKEKGNEKGN